MWTFAYLTEEIPASVHTLAQGTFILPGQSPYITVNSRKCCLHKSLACFSSGHLWILFNSALFFFFFSLGAYGWLDCVGPCQRPSITPWCPAELEIHSAALSPQNEKTRARWNKARLRERREREGKGGWKETKNGITATDRWGKKRRGKTSKERRKYKDE